MCWSSFSGCSQLASSSTVPLQHYTNSYRTCTDPHVQLPTIHTPIPTSWIILFHCIHGLKHHMLEEGVLHFIFPAVYDHTGSPLPQATQSHWHTRRCPTSLPHKENMVHHVMMLGASETILPHFHRNSPRSMRMVNPSTSALYSKLCGSLHSSPNWAKFSLTWAWHLRWHRCHRCKLMLYSQYLLPVTLLCWQW